jgi:hypothetical protein
MLETAAQKCLLDTARQRAWEMRLLGFTYDDIGECLGVTRLRAVSLAAEGRFRNMAMGHLPSLLQPANDNPGRGPAPKNWL